MSERQPSDIEPFLLSLPDPQTARVFLQRLESQHPVYALRCRRKPLLLSRLLTLAAYSPFLAENLLRYPDDIDWFERETERGIGQGKTIEQFFEDLSRLATRMYDAEARTLLARFKNRELLRIYLRDCLNLATLAELTEELSNLADVILTYALKLATQEVTNQHGSPLCRDERGRITQAEFVVIALGKLGCRELNYASDIDLMFLYVGAGETAGDGRAKHTVINNKDFFTKVAQRLVKFISGLAVDGGIYRVDLRLRPYGRDGDMVWEIARAADYYHQKAENWERQMLIRARAAAGNEAVFTGFFDLVRDVVFNTEPHPEALADVRRVKDQIDRKVAKQSGGYNVKLGLGGIREIEFIAQALQLAYGGREPWVRSTHTLIVLARLAEKGFLTEAERAALSAAYTFFRVVEHRLQMEHGAQTHTLPISDDKLELLARRCGYQIAADFTTIKRDAVFEHRAAFAFKRDVEAHAAAVRAIYHRVLSAGATNEAASCGANDSQTHIDGASVAALPVTDALHSSNALFDSIPSTSSSQTVTNAAANAENPELPIADTATQNSASVNERHFDEETVRGIHHAASALMNLFASQSPTPLASQPLTLFHESALETMIGAALDSAINPVRSLKNLSAWAESLATYNDEASQRLLQNIVADLPVFIGRLLAIFSSQYLSSILIARPLLSRVLFESGQRSTAQDFLRAMRSRINPHDSLADQADALRHAWYELILSIGSQDLAEVLSPASGVLPPWTVALNPQASTSTSSSIVETGGKQAAEHRFKIADTEHRTPDSELPPPDRLRESNLAQTALAEASLQLAAEITLKTMGALEALPFAIMGLGRLGHAGMDYGSDLDLLVVFDDAVAWPPTSMIQETATRFSTAQEFYAHFTAQLLKLLSSITREGFIYRVDLRLRPEGKNGQLAQGLTSLLAYLQERASAWEHSAYVKLREVAGDAAFGAQARQKICETVFAAASRNASLKDDLALMRARLEKEKAKGNPRDFKWGAGGMTDVYFITRFLQLRDGIIFPTEKGTTALIKELGKCGALDSEAAQCLFAGYTFLRHLDHWIRLLLDRPTQVLPASQVALNDLARALGLSSIEEFEQQYAHHTSAIRTVYQRVFWSGTL